MELEGGGRDFGLRVWGTPPSSESLSAPLRETFIYSRRDAEIGVGGKGQGLEIGVVPKI